MRISLGIYVCTQFDPWLGQPGVKPADSCGGSAGPQRSAKIFQQWCSAERDREPCGVVGPICPTATEGAAGREEGRCRPHLQSGAPGTPQGDHGLHHSAQPQVFLRVPLPMSALPTPVSPSFNVVVWTTLFLGAFFGAVLVGIRPMLPRAGNGICHRLVGLPWLSAGDAARVLSATMGGSWWAGTTRGWSTRCGRRTSRS